MRPQELLPLRQYRRPGSCPVRRWAVGIPAALLMVVATAPGAEPALTGDRVATSEGDLVIHPINHATLALSWNKLILYVDPGGGAKRFVDLPRPDLILLTDIHPDHLDAATLKALETELNRLVETPELDGLVPEEIAQTEGGV